MDEKVKYQTSWHASGSRILSCCRSWHRETAAIVFRSDSSRLEAGQLMALTGRRAQFARPDKTAAFPGFVLGLFLGLTGWTLVAVPSPAVALEMSEPVAALYTTVSIFPPSANSMTVCYGFVCRRREILD